VEEIGGERAASELVDELTPLERTIFVLESKKEGDREQEGLELWGFGFILMYSGWIQTEREGMFFVFFFNYLFYMRVLESSNRRENALLFCWYILIVVFLSL
jgi:hypothetical protein